jgi:hypothetical protein
MCGEPVFMRRHRHCRACNAEGAGTEPRGCAVVNRKRSGAIADVPGRGFF